MEGRVPEERELTIYKAYLDDLGRLGGRHETVRAYYLTAVTALATLVGLTSPTGALADTRDKVQLAIGVGGALLALTWSAHMRSFGVYFKAKREVLAELEEGWSLKPFASEVSKTSKQRYYRVSYVDHLVAAAFFVIFAGVVITRW